MNSADAQGILGLTKDDSVVSFSGGLVDVDKKVYFFIMSCNHHFINGIQNLIYLFFCRKRKWKIN